MKLHCSGTFDFEEWLYKDLAWRVTDVSDQSIDLLCDSDLKSAIISDILHVTIFEIVTKTKIYFSVSTLVRFINDPIQVNRIARVLKDPSLRYLLDISKDAQIRIKPESGILHDAMEYADEWFDGSIFLHL